MNLFSKILLAFGLLALVGRQSNAFLLGNIIGCNSFGCRLAALETEVNQIKNQLTRIQQSDRNGSNGNGQFNQGNLNQGSTMIPSNSNNNNNFNGRPTNNNSQLTTSSNSMMQPNELNRVYGNALNDYNSNGNNNNLQQQQQAMRRSNINNGYLNGINNQFFRA